MQTIAESLRSISAYPIPPRTLEAVAASRGVDLCEEAYGAVTRSSSYRLCEADLLMWLSAAPDLSQGGQTYSFTDAQRTNMRSRAQKLYDALDPLGAPKVTYGYKGSQL